MRTRKSLRLNTTLIAVALSSSALWGQRALKNDTDMAARVTAIADSNGQTFAFLYVMPRETLHLSAQGRPIGGAGYYEAVKGDYFRINPEAFAPEFETKAFGGECGAAFEVDKVGWDSDGKLSIITGLRPVLHLTGLDVDVS